MVGASVVLGLGGVNLLLMDETRIISWISLLVEWNPALVPAMVVAALVLDIM